MCSLKKEAQLLEKRSATELGAQELTAECVRRTAALDGGEGGGFRGQAMSAGVAGVAGVAGMFRGQALGRRVHELADERAGGVASQQAQAMSAGVAGVAGMSCSMRDIQYADVC